MSERPRDASAERRRFEGLHLRRIGAIAGLTSVLMGAYPQEASILPPQTTSIVRLTDPSFSSSIEKGMQGTDLGIPFALNNEETEGETPRFGFVFGDTFTVADPHAENAADGWRSPVILYSNSIPNRLNPIQFTSAAGLEGPGIAPAVMHNGYNDGTEFTVIPNSVVNLPRQGMRVLSYMSVKSWQETPGEDGENWQTNYAGLAVSYDGGNHFERTGPRWWNDENNDDPFQMQSMQLDGDRVYVASAPAGRQDGPLLMQRVLASEILNKDAYECWNGSTWGSECVPLFAEEEDGRVGEPSLVKMRDSIWVLTYLDLKKGGIIARTAYAPTGPWSDEKMMITAGKLRNLYGGFTHQSSMLNDWTGILSSWQKDKDETTHYGIYEAHGTLPRPPAQG